MKLAAIQYKPPKAQPDTARRELRALIDAAGQQGADLIVCPEMAISGYIWEDAAAIAPYCEPARGPTFQMLSQLAKKHSCWIICGFAERYTVPQKGSEQPGEYLFNSALVVTPEGALATCYRKVLLYEADLSWAVPGWRRQICNTEFGRFAPGICMDINDPGFTDFLRLSRPDILAFCTNWVQEDDDVHAYWRQRLQGWRGWMVAANSWGTDQGTRFCGRSAIIAPSGEIVAQASALGNEVLLVNIIDVPAMWAGDATAEA